MKSTLSKSSPWWMGLIVDEVNGTMVVTVISVRMMEMPVHQIIDMIPMRHGFVATPWTMSVIRVMLTTLMARGALRRIVFGHFQLVALHSILAHVMKMTIVQIIDMIAVPDCGMATSGLMLMLVIGMNGFAHRILSFR